MKVDKIVEAVLTAVAVVSILVIMYIVALWWLSFGYPVKVFFMSSAVLIGEVVLFVVLLSIARGFTKKE